MNPVRLRQLAQGLRCLANHLTRMISKLYIYTGWREKSFGGLISTIPARSLAPLSSSSPPLFSFFGFIYFFRYSLRRCIARSVAAVLSYLVRSITVELELQTALAQPHSFSSDALPVIHSSICVPRSFELPESTTASTHRQRRWSDTGSPFFKVTVCS